MATKLPISLIDRADTTFQFRVTTVSDNVADLARQIGDGYEMDPIEVRPKEGGMYQIIDGFQRTEAYFLVHGDKAEVPARVLKLSDKQAALRAAAANQKYRAKLSKQDRANIIKELLFRFPHYSNTRIAEICRLEEGTIRNHRKRYPELQTEEREGLDGKKRKLPSKGKVSKDPDPEKPTDTCAEDGEQELEASDETSPGDENATTTTSSQIKIKEKTEASPDKTEISSEEPNPSPVWHDILLAEMSGKLRDIIEELEMKANVLENFSQKAKLAQDEEIIRDLILEEVESLFPLKASSPPKLKKPPSGK